MKNDLLIVGAGMAGLMAARTAQAKGLRVVILEQNEVVGGRMETLAFQSGLADTGAQFITARSPKFRQHLESWIRDRSVFSWASGYSTGSLAPSQDVEFLARYAASGGMAKFARSLALGLDVRTNLAARSARKVFGGWQVVSAGGEEFEAKSLFLTPPLPISLLLLQQGNVELPPFELASLQSVRYLPSFVGSFHIDGEIFLPPSGSLIRAYQSLISIADNHRKGISSATIVTVQSNPHVVNRFALAPDSEILAAFEAELRDFLTPGTQIVSAQLRRWKYATCENPDPRPCFTSGDLPGLVIGGDAFGRYGGLEGAALSGLAASEAILNQETVAA